MQDGRTTVVHEESLIVGSRSVQVQDVVGDGPDHRKAGYSHSKVHSRFISSLFSVLTIQRQQDNKWPKGSESNSLLNIYCRNFTTSSSSSSTLDPTSQEFRHDGMCNHIFSCESHVAFQRVYPNIRHSATRLFLMGVGRGRPCLLTQY